MIDLNIRALTDLSLAFVDSLARHRGGMLNVGSMAGFLPGPGMAVYYASKAYVLSFSEALHGELKPRGVRVTVLCPGPVPTEFAARAGVKRELLAPDFLTRAAGPCAEGGLPRADAGPPRGGAGLANKLTVVADPACSAQIVAGGRGRPPEPRAGPRNGHSRSRGRIIANAGKAVSTHASRQTPPC